MRDKIESNEQTVEMIYELLLSLPRMPDVGDLRTIAQKIAERVVDNETYDEALKGKQKWDQFTSGFVTNPIRK